MKTFFQLLLPLLFISCCNAQMVNLSLKLKKGETYSQTSNSTAIVNQSVNGQKIKMIVIVSGETSYQVKNVTTQDYEMEVRFKKLEMSMSLPNGKSVRFSSGKEGKDDIMSKLFSGMIDKPFFLALSREGKVDDVKGIDTLIENMVNNFPELPDEKKEQLKDQLIKSFGKQTIKGNFEMWTAVFPAKSVSKGDKWNVTTQLKLPADIDIKSTYELTSETDSGFVIIGNSKIVTPDNEKYINLNGLPAKYDLNGSMTSHIEINKKSGWITRSGITQKIEGFVNIKDNPKVPGGMTIPMTMENNTSIWDPAKVKIHDEEVYETPPQVKN